MDPQIEWRGPQGFADVAGLRRGHDEVREYVKHVASLHLWTVRDGKATSFRVYWDRAEGLEAVGMSTAR